MAAVLTKPTAGIKKDMDCGPWGIGQANLGEKKRKGKKACVAHKLGYQFSVLK